MAESKKGHNFAIQGPTEKKTKQKNNNKKQKQNKTKKNSVRLFFCTDATYKISSP